MDKFKNLLVYGLTIILFLSCTSEKMVNHPAFDEQLINEIAKGPEVDIIFVFSYAFVQGENNKIIQLDPRELHEIYMKGDYKMSYKEFLTEALNQKLKFKGREGNVFFELNPKVTNNYNNNSFFDFLKLYCEQRDEEYVLNNNVPEEYINTIFYYAFINNYLVSENDGLGRDFIRSTSYCIEILYKYHYFE